DRARARRVALVDEGDDVLAEIRVVVADGGRVDELGTAERRPCVDEDDARRGAQVVDELDDGRAEGGTVPPHVHLPGEPLDEVDRRERRALRTGRLVHPEWAPGGIAERITRERSAVELVLVQPDRKSTRLNSSH